MRFSIAGKNILNKSYDIDSLIMDASLDTNKNEKNSVLNIASVSNYITNISLFQFALEIVNHLTMILIMSLVLNQVGATINFGVLVYSSGCALNTSFIKDLCLLSKYV